MEEEDDGEDGEEGGETADVIKDVHEGVREGVHEGAHEGVQAFSYSAPSHNGLQRIMVQITQRTVQREQSAWKLIIPEMAWENFKSALPTTAHVGTVLANKG